MERIRVGGQSPPYILAVTSCLCLAAGVCGAAEPGVDPVRAAFDAADADQDRFLSPDEFESRPGDPKVLQRDFRLFDFDRSGSLSRGEFAAIPGLVPASKRGALPDPFDHLVVAAVEAVDESFKGRDGGRIRGVKVVPFLATVVGDLVSSPPVMKGNVGGGGGFGGGGIGGGGFGGGGFRAAGVVRPDGNLQIQLEWSAQADPDGDGFVTWAEAKRFVEIHLGVRAKSGETLRHPNGCVVALDRFSRIDANGNLRLERDEFFRHSDLFDPTQHFERSDRDRDGLISLTEFSHPDGDGYVDPIVWFRDADRDLDGFLEFIELERATSEQATGESRKSLIATIFPAFDEDRNRKLSLDEYRLSMLGNPIAAWEDVPLDENDDYILSFDEFQYGAAQCELLRLFYFHRLDVNKDNKLSLGEFPFRRQPPRNFHLLAADGSEFRRLYANEEYPHCGSPAVSPGGKTIAFDGRHGGESLREQRILMISIDGTGFRDVCEGLMPTWSKDGKQFACSRYEPESGIWIINADGSGARRIGGGWGAQWSPDGKTIAYTNNNSVWAYDVARGKSREVLSSDQHNYRTIYWNMCWSPDSRRLVFKARTRRGADLASIRMTGDDRDLRVHFSGDGSIEPDTAWSPDGQRIVFSMESPDSSRRLLYELDPTQDGPPKLVKGIDPSLTYKTSTFTRDGKWIIVSTMDLGGQLRNAAIDQ